MKILNETNFMSYLGGISAVLIKDTVDSRHPRIGLFNRPFTVQEEYLRVCLISAGEVITACDQLNYALIYLSRYQSRRTLEGELITRADYIIFQMENFYLRLGMIPDRSLRLTNEVFRLGLPARDCSERTVTDNEHVWRTHVRERLRAIDKVVNPHREARNKIAHLSRYNDSAFLMIELFFMLQKSKDPTDDSLLEDVRHLYKRETDAYVEAKRKELGHVARVLVEEVSHFFESLLPTFKLVHEKLK